MSLSGSANVGIINNGTDEAQNMMYQNISITATGAGETDGGLTFGATLSVRSGDDVDLDVGDLGTNDDGDSTGDALDDSANDGTMDALSDVSFGSIYVSGEFGTLTFDRGGIDNVHDDGFSHDVSYAYSGGGLSLTVTADIDNDDDDYEDGEEWAASVGYTMDALTLTFLTDDGGESDTTIAYAVNDMITASLNYDTDGQEVDAADTNETIVKVAYANDGVSAHFAWADDDDDAWEVGLGYTAGAMSFSAVVGEDSDDGANDETEYDVTASYDLGGGMSINGATNESGAWYVGTALAF